MESALKRIGRISDGWLPTSKMGDGLAAGIQRYKNYAKGAGRDPAALAIVLRGSAASGTQEDWRSEYTAREALGGTTITVNPGKGSVDGMLQNLRRYKEAVDAR